VVNCVGNGCAVLMKTSPSRRLHSICKSTLLPSTVRVPDWPETSAEVLRWASTSYQRRSSAVICAAVSPTRAWLHHRRRRTQQAPGGYSTSISAQDYFAIILFLLPWVCGDQLLSSLHNFKYHLHECNNPGMASTAGGVYSRRKPEPLR
jgi:hypothetical protein